MTVARTLLREAREAETPNLPIEAVLGGSDAWSAVFEEIDVAVRAAIDAIDDDELAAVLVGRTEGIGDHQRGHRLGQLSEQCVEAVTENGLFEGPASDLVPLWRAIEASADDAVVDAALDGDDPAEYLDDVESALTLVANDQRDLGDARFDAPVDSVWDPIERIIIATIDGHLEHRFGHDVEY